MTINRIINEVFNSCSYIVKQGRQSWLVDCGDTERILPLIDGELCGVLITHAHFDHIYGLNRLISVFPDVPVFTNAAGREGLLSDKINLSRYHESPFVLEKQENIRVIGDGEMIHPFDGVTAQAVFTPGHSPGCVTWVMDDAVFTGDSFIPGTKTVTILPHADKALAARSEAHIRDLIENREVYPGHFTDNDETSILKYID